MFRSVEPYYLAIGMSDEQFWHGDVWLVETFREAHRMKVEMRNQELYLQGLYNFRGYGAVIANFAQSFSKKKGKQEGYLKEPIRITPMTAKEKRKKERAEVRALRRQLEMWKKTEE